MIKLKELKRKYLGFMGLTHVLSTIALTMALVYFGVPQFQHLFSSVLIGILGMMVIIGASLMPDLDNPKENGGSSATYALGILGDIINVALVSISGIVYQLTATKRERGRPPKTQHRMLWHAPLVVVPLILWLSFSTPNTQENLYSMGASGLGYFFQAFLISISMFLGFNFTIKKLKKFIPFYNIIMAVLPIAVSAGVALLPFSTLRYLCFLVAYGCLSHIIGDMLTKGGCALFPIPTWHGGHMYMWWHWTFLGKFSIDTANTVIANILNIIFFSIAMVFIILMFI